MKEEARNVIHVGTYIKLPQKDDKGQRRKVQTQILPKGENRVGTGKTSRIHEKTDPQASEHNIQSKNQDDQSQRKLQKWVP